MSESTFTLRVETGLKEAFVQAAKLHDRTGAQLLRDFMRDFVQRSREMEEYETWFKASVEAGRLDAREGRVAASDEVEARAAQRQAMLLERRPEARK